MKTAEKWTGTELLHHRHHNKHYIDEHNGYATHSGQHSSRQKGQRCCLSILRWQWRNRLVWTNLKLGYCNKMNNTIWDIIFKVCTVGLQIKRNNFKVKSNRSFRNILYKISIYGLLNLLNHWFISLNSIIKKTHNSSSKESILFSYWLSQNLTKK